MNCVSRLPHTKQHRQHMKNHTGEKPYEFSQCYMSLPGNDNLIQYMKIHNGEKQKHCGMTFSIKHISLDMQ